MPPRRTVLTGLGLVTPLGPTAATWDALRAGHSGIRPLSLFDPKNLPVRFGGEVQGFDIKTYIPKENKDGRKQIKVMARGIQLAVAAAQVAMDDGKVDKAKLDPARFGIEFGSGLLATELEDLAEASKVSVLPPDSRVQLPSGFLAGLSASPRADKVHARARHSTARVQDSTERIVETPSRQGDDA